MTDIEAILASSEPLTKNQIADLLADVLPPSVPALTRAMISAGINAFPADQLPEISRVFREGMVIARDQGIEAFCDFLHGLGIPDEMIDVVRRYAPEQLTD